MSDTLKPLARGPAGAERSREMTHGQEKGTPMTREPAEPLRLDYLIKAGTIHSMTGKTYRSVGLRGAEIAAVSAKPDGLDDLVGHSTAVVDAGDLTLLPAFADSHEHLMEASRNTLLVPVDQARSVAEFTGMVADAARDAAPGKWILTSIGGHESSLADRDQQRVAAGLHQVLVRVGEGRQQRELAGIDYRGAATSQVVQPVRIGRHRRDLRAAHAHATVGGAGHRMDSPRLDQVVES